MKTTKMCVSVLLLLATEVLGVVAAVGTVAVTWQYYRIVMTWNSASRFCHEKGGHLPVVHTHLARTGLQKIVDSLVSNNVLNADFWSGLYTPIPNELPVRWEGVGLIQLPYDSFWVKADGEPDFLGSQFCVRVDRYMTKLRTKDCELKYSTVCEFSNGCCTKDLLSDVELTNLSPAVSMWNITNLSECWSQCLQLFMSEQECILAEWTANSTVCKLYIGLSLLTSSDVTTTPKSGAYVMLRKCFSHQSKGWEAVGYPEPDPHYPIPAVAFASTSPSAANFTCDPTEMSTRFEGTVAGNWMLYTGLSLAWNDASQFCRDQGGHLPVINTHLAMNGLTEAIETWRAQGVLHTFWTGLYSTNVNVQPYMWEGADQVLSAHVDYFQSPAGDFMGGVCVTMGAHLMSWMPGYCNTLNSVVCEFNTGCCTYEMYPDTALSPLESVRPNDYAAAICLEECWVRCLDLRMSGRECVAAEWEESSAVCKLYTRNSFFNLSDIVTSPGTSLLLRKCFSHGVSELYLNYTPQLPSTSADPSPAPPLSTPDNSFMCDTASTLSCPGETSTVPIVTTAQQVETTTMSTATTSEPTVATTTQGDITVSGNTTIVPIDTSSDATAKDRDTTVSGDTIIVSIDTSSDATAKERDTTVSGDTTILPIGTSSDATAKERDTTSESGSGLTSEPYQATTQNAGHSSTWNSSIPVGTPSGDKPTTSQPGGTQPAQSTTPSTADITKKIPLNLCPCKKLVCQRSDWRPSPLNLHAVPRKSTSKYRRHVTSTWSGPSRSQIILGVTMTTVSIMTVGLFLYCDVRRLTTRFGEGGGRAAGTRPKAKGGRGKGRGRKKEGGSTQQERHPAESEHTV